MLTTPSSRRFRRVACIAAVAAITLAACGGDDDSDADTAPAATNAATNPAPAETPATTVASGGGKGDYGDSSATTMAPESGGAAIQAGDTSLGSVATGSDGLTLYAFMPDAQGAPTCTGECAANWPPVIVGDGATPTPGDGIDASKLGTVANPEGGTQLTYGGWPLYYFGGDQAAGDTNGQGLNDVWYAMGADGSAIDDD
jgi:predicted lipoprotein with Yx(FWY)xxD motif